MKNGKRTYDRAVHSRLGTDGRNRIEESIAESMKRMEHRKMLCKHLCEYFTTFSRYLRPWLRELTERYKQHGVFPVMGCWLLPSYYTDTEDVEVAAFLSLLLKDDGHILQRVEEFRTMMGDHPYQWLMERRFITVGDKERRTGGVLNMDIAAYANLLYSRWTDIRTTYPMVLMQHFGTDKHHTAVRLLQMVLGLSDGFGLGLWQVDKERLKSPLTKPVRSLLRTFFPDYLVLRDPDRAIRQFGFDVDSDFFFAALAYRELQRQQPVECSWLATVYERRYRECVVLNSRYWTSPSRGVLPRLDDFLTDKQQQ